jgi:ribosomal protein L11 methyltransferase
VTLDLALGGSAFGGGSHPTTASCLEILGGLAPLRGSVLDLGSGSGILALAALRLGAARATCVDVNPEAVDAARRNGEANGLASRLDHRLGSVEVVEGERFELVVANIGGELLLELAGRIAPLVRPGGRLLVSGLLVAHGDELVAAYAARGLAPLDRREAGGFCTALLEAAP